LYQLKLDLYGPDKRQLEALKNNLININVVPPEISCINIINARNKENVKLDESLSPLKFKFFDNENNLIVVDDPIFVMIDSTDFEIVYFTELPKSGSSKLPKSSIHLKPCTDQTDEFVMDCTGWALKPKHDRRKELIEGKEVSFVIKLTSKSLKFPEVNIYKIVFPGAPTAFVSLTNIQVKLNHEPKSMHLVVQDKWGNPVAPISNEQWCVELVNGPLKLSDSEERLLVDERGMISTNRLMAVIDYEAEENKFVEQRLRLISSSEHDTCILEGAVSVKIIPSNIPTTLKVKYSKLGMQPLLHPSTFCLLDISW
jgi:hypothetical protein